MRRVAVVLALLCSGTAISAAPNVVHAAEPAAVVENIYRTQVVQTTGPASSALPWGLDRIDQRDLPLSGSYSYTATGAGVKAYIVDSGIKADHVEFAGRVASGWSYRSASASTLNSWRTSLGSCKTPPAGSRPYDASEHPFDVDEFDYTSTPSDVGSPDNHGHGTHVAGTVGGTNTGVAKGVTLVPVRVLNSCGSGISSMLLAGLDWILEDHQLGEPAVVNMSIGFTSRDYDIDDKIAELMAEGIVVVAAAGNKGTSACSTTPAATPGTISVGASTNTDTEASFSNHGECVDMYAPGASIASAWNYQGFTANPYSLLSGTSMAAPHVAGVVARYLQGVVTTGTTETETWSWLNANMTTGKISRPLRSPQTPNKLLAAVNPDDLGNVTITAGQRQVSATWTSEPGLPYVMTATPGGATCTSTTFLCTLTGLLNGQLYSISISGTNSYGTFRRSTSVATPVGPPVSVTSLSATVQSQSLFMSWARGEGDGGGVTYTATATPGGLACSTTTTSCTITGLTNGTEYSVSVVGANALGTTSAMFTSGMPDGKPEAPATATSLSLNKSIALSWGAVLSTINLTYVVTSRDGTVVCRTAQTSCVVDGLLNGVNYNFAITTSSATGQVAETSLSLSVRPGFTVKKTEVVKKSSTLLSRLLTSVSPGKKTWKEAGVCSIVRGRLVVPNRKTNCSLSLSVAKTSKYPAMKTRVTIWVK